MAIWIQSLSWTLIFSLGQGLAVYGLLRLVFKLMPGMSSNARYHLSLSALTILLGWFVATWWQQYHSLALANEQLLTSAGDTTIMWLPLQHISVPDGLTNLPTLKAMLSLSFPWLCACYVIGFALMLARLSAGIWQLYSLRISGTVPTDVTLDAILQAQKKRIDLDKPVQLLLSAKAQVPMVIGFFKPIVLMPAAAIAQLDPIQLETILLHELAHIKRHDYLVNILQTIAETILFFNPFVWLIGKSIRREREHCCDDLVVGHTPDPLFYATALAVLASRKAVVSPMMIAASGQPPHLYNRIQRIMEIKKQSFSYSRMVATIILIAAVACSVAWIRPTFPKTKKSKAGTTKTAKTSVETATVTREITDVTQDEGIDTKKDKSTSATPPPQPTKEIPDENVLVQRLLDDKLIDQVKGFVVEKRRDKLLINGELQTDDVAAKYLPGIKKAYMRLQVFSLEKRMQMHPGSNFIQLFLPFTFESECVDKQPEKEGC